MTRIQQMQTATYNQLRQLEKELNRSFTLIELVSFRQNLPTHIELFLQRQLPDDDIKAGFRKRFGALQSSVVNKIVAFQEPIKKPVLNRCLPDLIPNHFSTPITRHYPSLHHLPQSIHFDLYAITGREIYRRRQKDAQKLVNKIYDELEKLPDEIVRGIEPRLRQTITDIIYSYNNDNDSVDVVWMTQEFKRQEEALPQPPAYRSDEDILKQLKKNKRYPLCAQLLEISNKSDEFFKKYADTHKQRYLHAYYASNALFNSVSNTLLDYLNSPESYDLKVIKALIKPQIKLAQNELGLHRGWPRYLVNLLKGMASLGGLISISNQSFFKVPFTTNSFDKTEDLLQATESFQL